MLVTPAVKPDTIPEPEPMFATAGAELDHVPPLVLLVRDIVLPAQMVVGEPGIINAGKGLTVRNEVT